MLPQEGSASLVSVRHEEEVGGGMGGPMGMGPRSTQERQSRGDKDLLYTTASVVWNNLKDKSSLSFKDLISFIH